MKSVHVERAESSVQRGAQHAGLERQSVADVGSDSGEVETLPDGSLSIPLLEEEIVVTKRWVVRERVIVRTSTVYEDQVVSADVRRETVEIEATGDAVVTEE